MSDQNNPGSTEQKGQKDVFLQGFALPKGLELPSSQSYVIEEEKVETKFSGFSERYGKMVNHYYALIEEIALFDFKQTDVDISIDEFRRYCNTILFSRIMYVRKKASLDSVRFIIGPTDPVVLIPDVLKVIINHIGVCRDKEQGLIFEPNYSLDGLNLKSGVDPKSVKTIHNVDYSSHLMTEDEMHDLARKLIKYQRAGVSMWTNYHRDIAGCPSFMGFCVVQDQVMHHLPKQSFTKALLATVMDITGIEMVVRPRMFYGSVNKMDLYLSGLIQRKST